MLTRRLDDLFADVAAAVGAALAVARAVEVAPAALDARPERVCNVDGAIVVVVAADVSFDNLPIGQFYARGNRKYSNKPPPVARLLPHGLEEL